MNYKELLSEEYDDLDGLVSEESFSETEIENLEEEFDKVCAEELDQAEQNIEVESSSFLQACKKDKGLCLKCGNPLKACKCRKTMFFKKEK